jgi:hypothetical protein
MNKHRLLLLAPVLLLGGCFEHKVKMHHDTVKLEQLKPESHVSGDRHAQYAYQDPSGIWWYYWMLNSSSSSTSSTTSSPSSSYSYSTASGSRASFPSGGTWSRSTTGPAKADVEEEEEATIDETEQGPATAAQETEAAENGGEVTETESTGAASASVEPAAEQAAPAAEPAGEAPAGEAGGGDAGGGGGDGGGGGGDGGGGE